MAAPVARRASRKWIGIGLLVITAAAWEAKEALDSYRTGEPIHTYRHTTMQWWEQIPLAGLTVLFGLIVVAAGLGWIKPRGERPM